MTAGNTGCRERIDSCGRATRPADQTGSKTMTLITLLAVAAAIGSPQAQSPVAPFPDVPPDHWAFPAVESLRVKGIVRGYPDGNFRGKRTITRYELAAGLDSALRNMPTACPGPAGPQGPTGPRGERGP